MKSYLILAFAFIFMISLASASVTVNLNSPANNDIVYVNYTKLTSTQANVQFNCSATTTSNYIQNISLWTNDSGTWERTITRNNGTTEFANYGHGVPFTLESTDTGTSGEVIIAKQNGVLNSLIKNSTATPTICSISNNATGSYVVKKQGTFVGDSCLLDYEITAGQSYRISFNASGSTYNLAYTGNINPYPLSNNQFDWVGTFFQNGALETNIIRVFTNITFSPSPIFNFTLSKIINWSCQATDDANANAFSTQNRTLILDANPPDITITTPSGILNYSKFTGNLTLNFTATDTNLGSCWYNYNNTNHTVSCSSGVLSSNQVVLTTQKNLTVYANDTIGNLNSSFVNWDYKVFENSRTYNTTTYETAYETYKINVTSNTSLTAVQLNYNGSLYSMTNQGSGIWSYSRDIPSSALGSQSFNYRFTFNGGTFDSDNSTQVVSNTFFGLCSATYSDDFLNITFKDENNLSSINGTIPTSTFEYYLGSGTQTKTYSLVNNTENQNYGFCVNPTNRTIHVDPYIQYASSGYPQRIWNPSLTDYTNSTTSQVLYLLSSLDGLYVTFQLINPSNQVLSGVTVNASRSISGSDVLVGSGITGDDGSVTFWLNPDFEATFTFVKSGFTTLTSSFAPTQSGYTITMGGGTSQQIEDYTKGITLSIYPEVSADLVNDTVYNFNMTIATSFWDLDSFGFILKLPNGTTIGSTSSTDSSGGIVNLDINTSNYTRIIMTYYWTINGTNSTRIAYWNIRNSDYSGFSILTFFTDLKSYLDSGLFGIDSFGRVLFVFLVLLISTRILSYKYGVNNPTIIIAIMFCIVMFFDWGIGLIPNPVGRIPNFPTFIAGIVLITTILKEVYSP